MLSNFLPLTYIFPWTDRLSLRNLPESQFRKVVFPEPDGPIIAVNYPDFITPYKLLSIGLVILIFFPSTISK